MMVVCVMREGLELLSLTLKPPLPFCLHVKHIYINRKDAADCKKKETGIR